MDIIIFSMVLFWMLGFIIKGKHFKKIHIYSFILFFVLMLLGAFVNVSSGYYVTNIGFFLFLKITVYFLFTLIAKRIMLGMDQGVIRRLFIVYLISYIALSGWAFFYIFFYDFFFVGWHQRPSFPFIKGAHFSDAHLFGSYLAISFFFFIFSTKYFLKMKSFSFFMGVIGVIGTIGLISTGSRSALFSVAFGGALLVLSLLHHSSRYNLKLFITGVISVISVILIFPESLYPYFDRAISFNLDGASEGRRLSSLLHAINYSGEWFYLMGSSLLFAKQAYFDGTVTFLIYNFGIVPAFGFVCALVFFSIRFLIKRKISDLVMAVSLFGLIASEYFLVGRWFVPIFSYYIITTYIERFKLVRAAVFWQK